MFGLKKLRFVDFGTGLSMMIGTAGLLVASALHAEEPGFCAPAPSRPMIQGGGCCDKVFEDAAERLKNLNPGCCAPAGNACAAPAACTPAATVCDPNAVFNGCGSGCGNGCGHGCGLLGGELGDPWTVVSLFDNECGGNRFKDNGWVLGGFTQFGYQSGPDGAFVGNGPFVNQKEYKTFALNQQYLFLGKVADGSKGFDWGFRADVMFGLDGNEGQSFGNNLGRFDFQEDFNHGAYEWAIPQLYAEVAMNDLSVKLGHFYTPIGYEVIPSNGNFFLSRQLTFYNSEPFTHTGALATYKASDKLSVIGGAVYGMDTGFDQFNGGAAAIWGATYAVDDKTSLIYAAIGGNLGWRGDGAINSLILTRKWGEKWSTVHQFDVLESNLNSNFNLNPTRPPGGGGVIEGIANDSVGLINYAFYDLTPKTKAGARYEWYKADGTSYQTLTGGVNYKPIANFVIRPEVRYMFSEGNHQSYRSAPGPNPSYRGELFNSTQFGIDAILTF